MTDVLWLPRIQASLCTGCEYCIAACPTGALGMQDGTAFLRHADLCSYCADCETVCPVGAVELPYLVCKSSHNGVTHVEVS